MRQIKSPFLIVQDFISPLLCEQFVDELDFVVPDEDIAGNPIKMIVHHERLENIIYDKFLTTIPDIESYYGVSHRGTTEVDFSWFPQGYNKSEMMSENSKLINIAGRKKWAKTEDNDLTCLLFLTEHCYNPNFDSLYEVYGGKINFGSFGFGFNAERGTLIVYPSCANFNSTVSPVQVGDLIFAKFHIATKNQFIFNLQEYPGTFKEWFNHIP